jgi:hypothetical protein
MASPVCATAATIVTVSTTLVPSTVRQPGAPAGAAAVTVGEPGMVVRQHLDRLARLAEIRRALEDAMNKAKEIEERLATDPAAQLNAPRTQPAVSCPPGGEGPRP